MVRLDLHNAYARLGVSPLLPTDEIKEVINRKRKEVMRRRRTRGEQQFGEEEAEMTRLQAIEDEIGTPKARARYDRLNPQNALLTIQPGPGDVVPRPQAPRRPGHGLARRGARPRELAPVSREPGALGAQGLDPDLVAFLDRVRVDGRPRERTARGRRIGTAGHRRARPHRAWPLEPQRPSGGGGTVRRRIITMNSHEGVRSDG